MIDVVIRFGPGRALFTAVLKWTLTQREGKICGKIWKGLNVRDFSNIHALGNMQNIEIRLNLHLAFELRRDEPGEDQAVASANRLLNLFAGNTNLRNQCVVKIKWFYDYHFLLRTLPYAVRQLVGFRLVVLKIERGLPPKAHPTCKGWQRSMEQIVLHLYRRLDPILKVDLGPGESRNDAEGVLNVRYHPREFLSQLRIQD